MAGFMNGGALKTLTAPARNNYFYGKLLDVFHFQMEQCYFNDKRWLLNRLGLGNGVLCGLLVDVMEDGQTLRVQPGVAIDALGREIIVTAPYAVTNVRQPTDECGRPQGDPITGAGVVTLCLAYHECEAEPVPVLVGDCDTRQSCAPNIIRERFRLQVRAGEPETRPGQITDAQCQAILPHQEASPDFDRRIVACNTLSGLCPSPANECVVLATVILPGDATAPLTVDACTFRSVVYSNSLLWELLSCLAARVDECCRVRLLRYGGGDAQSAEPGAEVTEPLVVEVVNGDGEPVSNETVTFRVRGGDGLITPDSVTTDATGQAQARWQLGPLAGLNTAEATISAGASVVFHALAAKSTGGGETPTPPVVTAIWPVNASSITRQNERLAALWLEQPRLAITFDREMNRDQLDNIDLVLRWLRIWQVTGGRQIGVRPVAFKLLDIADGFADQQGFTAIYALNLPDPSVAARYLVQMRPVRGNIVDTSAAPLLLDADFAGTALTADLLNQIWQQTDQQFYGREVADALADTDATLPQSGDGVAGGFFHSWFGVALGAN